MSPVDATSRKTTSLKAGLDTSKPKGYKQTALTRKPTARNTPALENAEEDFDWSKEGGGWSVEKWVESLDLHKLVGVALSPPEGASGYEHMRRLTREDIERRLRDPTMLDGLIDAVAAGPLGARSALEARGALEAYGPAAASLTTHCCL